MKELAAVFDRLRRNPEPAVLASLVEVQGSSYRRVGARLLWRPDGTRVGSISGGCLEEDLIERATDVLMSGKSKVVVYDTTRENDLVWGVGLGCHGVVHVLLERIVGIPAHWAAVEEAWAARQPAVVASIYGITGDAPRGTLLTVTHAHEATTPSAVARLAQTALERKQSIHHRNFDAATGATLFCEYLPPPLALRIFGAGDDAIPLVRLAHELGWRVTVTDSRSAYATTARFPLADDVRVERADAAAEQPHDEWTATVIMTHHYRFDLPLLRALLPRNLPYLGLLGPKRRATQLLDELESSGVAITPSLRESLHAPVGLDLGSGSPEQVALAIVAEIQAVFSGRDARPLRDRTQPIHA